jgi:RHS repeat-associated protein
MPLALSASGFQESVPACGTFTGLTVRSRTYTYDQFLNLASQTKNLNRRNPDGTLAVDGTCRLLPQESVTEAYQYDELQRLLNTQRSWSAGTNVTSQTTPGDIYSYDVLGNILTKSDYRSETYQYGGPRPHAVTSVGPITFTYDANGNMTGGDGRTVKFDNLDRPIEVQMGSGANAVTVEFRYAPDGSRYVQSSSDGTNEYYVDKMYEQIETSSTMEERTHLSDAVEIVQKDTKTIRYRHLDRLGSLDAATTDLGTEDLAYAHDYDAFGGPRTRDFQFSQNVMGQLDERGFTGHEHLDNVRLIHMNGRVYDYKLGRFLSVDPIISKPANSQSLNAYSYIGNNPLSGVDPTGYIEEKAANGILDKIRAGLKDGTITTSTALPQALKALSISDKDFNKAFAGTGFDASGKFANGAQIASVSAGKNAGTPDRMLSPSSVDSYSKSSSSAEGRSNSGTFTRQPDAGNPAASPDAGSPTGRAGDTDAPNMLTIEGSASYRANVQAQLDIIATTPAGGSVIHALQTARLPTTISAQSDGIGSESEPGNEENSQNGEGSSAHIYHNDTDRPEARTTAGKHQPTEPYIVLGHELSHALHYVNGTVDNRINPSTGILREEENAVKFENELRRALKMPERVGY